MFYVNRLFGLLVDTLLGPFERPWPALVCAALVTSVLMLLIMRWTSPGRSVRRARDRLTARVLELVLFRHDALVSLGAGGRILAANARYLATLAGPLAIAAVPCMLLIAQFACWFTWRPLRVGESALVEVKLRDAASANAAVELSASPLAQVEVGPLRAPALAEVDWRLRAERAGVDSIEARVGDAAPARKQIAVGDSFVKVSQRRPDAGLWNQVLNPGEPPLDPSTSIAEIGIRYPPRKLYLGNTDVDWLLAFVVLTIAFGLVLKRPLGVQI